VTQCLGRRAALTDQAEQDVLGADVVVIERPGLFLRQDNNPPRLLVESLQHAQRRLSSDLAAAAPCKNTVHLVTAGGRAASPEVLRSPADLAEPENTAVDGGSLRL
jgi:hypothetical protein